MMREFDCDILNRNNVSTTVVFQYIFLSKIQVLLLQCLYFLFFTSDAAPEVSLEPKRKVAQQK